MAAAQSAPTAPITGRRADTAASDVPFAGALRRLDDRITVALTAARRRFGEAAFEDPFRGLHITDDQVDALRGWHDGHATLAGEAARHPLVLPSENCPFGTIAARLDLDPFETDALLIAAAPDLAPGYERLFSYLQNDVARRRPSVGLALDLLCPDPATRLARLSTFGAAAPLGRRGLVVEDGDGARSPRELRLEAAVLDVIGGGPGLTHRLLPFVPADLSHQPVAPSPELTELVLSEIGGGDEPPPVFIHDAPGPAADTLVQALREAGRTVIGLDLSASAGAAFDWAAADELVRAARLTDAIVTVCGLETVAEDRAVCASLARLSAGAPLVLVVRDRPAALGAPLASALAGASLVAMPAPSRAARADRHASAARRAGVRLNKAAGVAALDDPDLAPEAAARAVLDAAHAVRRAGRRTVNPGDINDAARKAAGTAELHALAERIDPVAGWSDLILPDAAMSRLAGFAARIQNRRAVHHGWGFDDGSGRGSGLVALFSGEPGTGKTYAAEVIAKETARPLFRIDPARVVSKYIGETEKNLDRIFNAAAGSRVILLFDEADVFCAQRVEQIGDARDRYANLETGFLLQKMEQFDGVCIMTTNMRDVIDDAFLRRFSIVAHFPFPDAGEREAIWRHVLGAPGRVDPDLPFAAVAARYKLAGGAIRSAALAAAHRAEADGRGRAGLADVLAGVREEFQKLGKPGDPREFDAAVFDAGDGRS